MEEVAAVDSNPINPSDFCEKWAVFDPQVCPQQQLLPTCNCMRPSERSDDIDKRVALDRRPDS